MTTSPCKNCTNRRFENGKRCHATCKLYIDWRQKYDEENAQIRAEKKSSYTSIDGKWYMTNEGRWRFK